MNPQQPKRPWIVRVRSKSWRTGQWGRWRSHGTYTTEFKAKLACAGFVLDAQWDGYVLHRNELRRTAAADHGQDARSYRATPTPSEDSKEG